MSGRAELRAELTETIERTLREEARRSELGVAGVRSILLGLLVAIELSRLASAGGSVLVTCVTALGAVGAIGFALLLRRGWYAPWLALAVPVLDAAYIGMRLELGLSSASAEQLVDSQFLASVAILACILGLTGALRTAAWGTAVSAGLGLLLYHYLAWNLDISVVQRLIHTVLIGGTAGIGWALLLQVRRAAHSEVTGIAVARLLPHGAAAAAQEDPLGLLTLAKSVEATVLITDIRGFTSWSEGRAPVEVLDALNELQGALAAEVHAAGGTVDKFLGDGMLAVFGALTEQPDHAARALTAARAIRAVLAESSAEPSFAIGLGVHSGPLVVGALGSGLRLELTVLGDTVNTTSRLESMTKELGHDALVSATTARLAGEEAELIPLGAVPVRGRVEALEVYAMPPLE